ncbi:hypothetical protein JG688_00013813 [Phytophthora aleatoria]|uniref:Protein kinase domain-containing protein n=1 Tax=Phytophthora aleatoria TaxID=2496075 RepID=A0A8J5MDS0_9STRA|nr:hypothetical protein JG688_00013813 [Phytophthora aleatoria]
MDFVQTAAATTANVLMPGSGALVNTGFELAKICFQIAQILSGMEGKASSIKTQQINIKEDVENFRWVLEMLERVQNQDKLTDGLQKMIARFETEVKEYERVLNKFAKRTKEKLVERLTVECSIDGSVRHRTDHQAPVSLEEQVEERDKRYMEYVDSREVMEAMSDPESQKEMLAIIARMDITNLPDWYMTEDEVDIDMNTIVGFGGDAKIYRGELKDGTLVAVKIFNDDMKKTNETKQKFFNTMKPFVVMEYCDVGPLDKFLRDHESNRCQLGLEILVQAAQAFVKMHSIGIVHAGDAGVEISDAVRYVAPECVEGMLPNTKSDVYSFGMTLYHALSGKSPFFDITNDEELRL